MARVEGSANAPTEGFTDTPIHLRAVEESAYNAAVQKALEGDASELEARSAVTWNHSYTRENMADLAAMDMESHRRSASVIAEAALSGVGESLREARRRAGYTQVEAAAHVGITAQTLSRIERGADNPSLAVLVSLCWLYCIDIGRVLGMMTSDEEQLLTTYRATIDVNRPRVLRLAETVQAAKDEISQANATEAEEALIGKLRKLGSLAGKLLSRADDLGITEPIDWTKVL